MTPPDFFDIWFMPVLWPVWLRRAFIILFPITIPIYLIISGLLLIGLIVFLIGTFLFLLVLSWWSGENYFD